MRQSSRRWLAGAVLILALGVGGISVPSGLAQSPGFGIPSPGTAPAPQPAVSLVSVVGSPTQPPQPGLPAARPTGNEVQRQDGVIRLARNVPGDAKPIQLDADQITSWNEGGMVGFLLSGQSLIQQNVVQARFERGVAWVDQNRYKTTGILHVVIYAEGTVWVDSSSKSEKGERAILDLTTRGEFRVRAGKVLRQDRSGDPLVAKARAAGVGPRQATGVVPASGTTPAPALPPVAPVTPPQPAAPAIRPGGGLPAPPAPSGGVQQMSFEQPKPGQNGPASAGIQLVQATTTGPSASAIPDGAPDAVPPPLERLPPPVAVPAPTGSRSNLPATPSPDLPAPPAPDRPITLPPASPLPIPPPPEPTPPPVPGALPARSTPGLPLEYRILPRGGKNFDSSSVVMPDGKRVTTVTGGLILNVRNVPKLGIIDVEADRAVIWSTDNKDSDKGAARPPVTGESSNEVEFYLAGHVILRSSLNARDRSALEADELYYDARRNVAIALQSRLQLSTTRTTKTGGLPLINEPLIVTTPRLLQTGATTYEVREAELFSSKLPSDPGLKLLVASATITNSTREQTNLFGRVVRDAKGQPVIVNENIVTARDVVSELEGVPIFYSPYLKFDASDPMGPLETINFGENNVFGVTAGVGLNVYKLLGVQPIDGTHWRLLLDYMSRRGPALGTNFDYGGVLKSLTNNVRGDDVIPSYNGSVRIYGLDDHATDNLGGNRPYNDFVPTGFRGRAFWRQSVWDLPDGFDVVAQMSLLSDRNFLEQYFKREFDSEPNQSNFLYVKQQQDNWAWSALAQVQTSSWITTTQWLPRLDGYLIGQPIFDLFTTNTRVGAAFANLRPSSDPTQNLLLADGTLGPPLPIEPTRRDSTGRFSVLEEVAMPLDLGAFKVVPYVKGAFVGYTNDLEGNATARLWGAIGTRASLPLTRLYADAQSDLFNVNALNHKMVFTANYMYARANESHNLVPQLDQLNDDATNSMLREFKPQEPFYNPYAGLALATSPLFDPQMYAIRQLVMNRLDTLDDIQELQLDLRQRLQTKRGYPGAEHIVDWMTLDTSVSLFPQPSQNFGKSFSFAQYEYTWNLGDRTTFESTGLYDPQDQGPRMFTAGMYFNRPDRTSFYIGYRQIDPLQSRLITGSVNYVFSQKYSMTGSVSYDLGTSGALNNTIIFTRTGSDLQVSLGFSYNSLQNNFGAVVEIVPTLVPINRGGQNFIK